MPEDRRPWMDSASDLVYISRALLLAAGVQFRRSPAGRPMNQHGAAGENITAISAAILIRILNITFILNVFWHLPQQNFSLILNFVRVQLILVQTQHVF